MMHLFMALVPVVLYLLALLLGALGVKEPF